MRHLISVIFLLILGSTQALAAPAPYYLWMSKVDGSRVCTQTPPGEGWQKMSGPFKDSRCRKPA